MSRSEVGLVLALSAALSPTAIAAGGRAAAPLCRFAGGHARRVPPTRIDGCPRPSAGAEATPPADLYSRHGRLSVRLRYRTATDADGRALYCFVTPEGLQSPTLHVRPGDILEIVLENQTPPPAAGEPGRMLMGLGATVCGAAVADASSVNLHFHGLGLPAACHGDDVIHTSVNAGERFVYRVAIPRDQPPGVYWYHPHIHGLAEAAVQGGASGAIVVEGAATAAALAAGLPARLLVVRDQTVAGRPTPRGPVPSWDLSLNFAPVAWPALTPAVVRLRPGRRELWRLLNASADTAIDLRLAYDGVAQPLRVIGLDGVATRAGAASPVTHLLIPSGGRADVVVTAPTAGVARALLETDAIDTGPDGDNEPRRTLARLLVDPLAREPGPARASDASADDGAAALDRVAISGKRRLYFSEIGSDDRRAANPTRFFLTVAGDAPRVFNPWAPPAIVTRQGAVEDWTIENHARETHDFHIHAAHFMLLARDGRPLAAGARQMLDTVQIPYWRGGAYPSVTVRVDFRHAAPGDLLAHCHILQHEDAGMMAIVRILPRAATVRRAMKED